MSMVNVDDSIVINTWTIQSLPNSTKVTSRNGDTFELADGDYDVMGFHDALRGNGVPDDVVSFLREMGA